MFVIGIDIGKEELAASFQYRQQTESPQTIGGIQTVANTLGGLNTLVRWLEKQLAHHCLGQTVEARQVHVVMEATNVYWEVCAHHFHERGYIVSVVNPAQVKFFAKSTLRRGKTDAMDAEIIARYGLMMQPQVWTPPSQRWVEIKQMVREREAVLKQWSRENNHLQALERGHHASALALRLAKGRMRLLKRQAQVLEVALQQTCDQEPAIQAQVGLLMSVPGFAFIAAVTVLAETNGFATLTDGDQISAYSGMAPAPHQSGLTRGKGSISKVGNARLRRIAYLALLGACHSKSRFQTFYKALRERGKPSKVALVALARKLLRVALAVVKSGQPFQSSYVRAAPEVGT